MVHRASNVNLNSLRVPKSHPNLSRTFWSIPGTAQAEEDEGFQFAAGISSVESSYSKAGIQSDAVWTPVRARRTIDKASEDMLYEPPGSPPSRTR
jgi:hypothetical protein